MEISDVSFINKNETLRTEKQELMMKAKKYRDKENNFLKSL